MEIMIFKKDNLKLGLALGLVGPILGLVVIYFVKYSGLRFNDFLDLVFSDKQMLTPLGSLSLIANVVLFTLYINTHRDLTARGIFIVTLIYGIGILFMKII